MRNTRKQKRLTSDFSKRDLQIAFVVCLNIWNLKIALILWHLEVIKILLRIHFSDSRVREILWPLSDPERRYSVCSYVRIQFFHHACTLKVKMKLKGRHKSNKLTTTMMMIQWWWWFHSRRRWTLKTISR